MDNFLAVLALLFGFAASQCPLGWPAFRAPLPCYVVAAPIRTSPIITGVYGLGSPILSTVAAPIKNPSCNTWTDCVTCSNTANCMWMERLQRCSDTSYQCPALETCDYTPQTCPRTDGRCNVNELFYNCGCGVEWACDGTAQDCSTCVPKCICQGGYMRAYNDPNAPCVLQSTCSTASSLKPPSQDYCRLYTSCQECLFFQGCAWLSVSKSCQTVLPSTCAINPSCASTNDQCDALVTASRLAAIPVLSPGSSITYRPAPTSTPAKYITISPLLPTISPAVLQQYLQQQQQARNQTTAKPTQPASPTQPPQQPTPNPNSVCMRGGVVIATCPSGSSCGPATNYDPSGQLGQCFKNN